MKYTREILQKRFLSLPKDLREIIFGVETADKIIETAQKYRLPDEKISDLARVVGDILMGVLSLEKFANTLEQELKINRINAEQIARNVENEIFSLVRTSLRKAQETPLEAPPPPPIKPIVKEVEKLEKPKKVEKPRVKKKPPEPIKPSFFRKLFVKKEEKEAPILFEGKISTYERRRGVPPTPPTKAPAEKVEEVKEVTEKEIPTFPKELEKASQRLARLKRKKVDVGEYKIRTMKQDVARLATRQEKAKKQVIPKKPQPTADQPWADKPKIKNNIVDLSGR